ncbi:isochorismatase family protein [Prescottella sp. R16]|uniref:isochorismatase family protein n=1 Tax=Prescottella sp. R16 TaxID=3064529 RepID=UPI00351D94EF
MSRRCSRRAGVAGRAGSLRGIGARPTPVLRERARCRDSNGGSRSVPSRGGLGIRSRRPGHRVGTTPGHDGAAARARRFAVGSGGWMRPRSNSPACAAWTPRLFPVSTNDLSARSTHRPRGETAASRQDQLAVCGVFASQGVAATSFDALARDIQFFVVSDAVADYNATCTNSH